MKYKNSPPTAEQWEKLYEVALKIKQQAPWEALYDTDLITILLPEREEPVYISVMGRLGECYGIGVYPGYRSFNGLCRLMNQDEEDSATNPLFYQSCLVCYYGDRDELDPKERAIIKDLGLKFRGANNWIYFRSMEEGYYPWFINAEQAELLIDALQNFYMAFQLMGQNDLTVDFENGETLLRFYSSEQQQWLNTVRQLPLPPKNVTKIQFKDELLLTRLKSKKVNRHNLELDILFLPSPVQESPQETPYFPRLLLLLNRDDGQLFCQALVERGMASAGAAINALIDYIIENGRPKKLFVRDCYFMEHVESFCSLIQVPLVCAEGMPVTDDIAEQLLDFME